MQRDLYGLPLTAGQAATTAYNAGVGDLLRLRRGAVAKVAQAVALDPTFALGHAALALLGHELCAPVDVAARLADATLHARRSTERERSHVDAVVRHVGGESAALLAHLERWPSDALLLSTAVPTIAFAGVTTVPEQAWAVVERAAPAYGDDWWYGGLLGFVRQEQLRYDDAMDLAVRALAQEPAAGHAAHARAHAHYETADHAAGLAWMDGWITGDGADTDSLSHFSWHAALHELSRGDLAAVRRRYDAQLRPDLVRGCRTLVDTGSLLWRWQITPGASGVPEAVAVAEATGPETLRRPPTAFMALHAAVVLLAVDDVDGLADLAAWAALRPEPAFASVVAPLAVALGDLAAGRPGVAADALGALGPSLWRVGGSDAQREIVEETRIHALLRAGRYDDARTLLDSRLDRRRCRRDDWWRSECGQDGAGQEGAGQALVI